MRPRLSLNVLVFFFFLRVIARAARYRRLTGVSSCAEEFVMGPDASSLAIVFSFCDLFRFFCSKTFFFRSTAEENAVSVARGIKWVRDGGSAANQ